MSNSKAKVYEEVLKEIQKFITTNHLQSGDKLPSERELAEKLDAGRSSIREALRAMELLGLIETRRGEGTYLCSYQSYHTVELLSTFILNETHTRHDLLLTKKIIEKEATKLAFSHMHLSAIEDLKSAFHDPKLGRAQKHAAFFLVIFQYAENSLLQRIWELMENFTNTFHTISYHDQFYEQLIKMLENRKYEQIEELFNRIYL
ncbi:FadR/GntR family transcriptional regulator [Radiobacillus sp. PE A8.2]|uniref:FadR/GntR family transcriptional regulator n=1 Tax=Radiobacillus sp. PE A8.2 TaxID=3380349 RepID=UPI0038909ACD